MGIARNREGAANARTLDILNVIHTRTNYIKPLVLSSYAAAQVLFEFHVVVEW